MKQILLLMIMISLGRLTMKAQDFQRIIDKKTDRVMLQGRVAFKDVMDETAFGWFNKGFEAYQHNQMIADNLERFYAPYHLVVFMGTWCEDTHLLLPQLYKVLKHSNFDFNALTMYAVDRKKASLNEEHINYGIYAVPTIIVLHGDREVGRITETVKASIEHDLLAILEKDFMELEKKRIEKYGE